MGIVTSTTDISSVVEVLAPDDAKVVNIVPGGMCPGHFDLSPVEANLIFLSDLIIYHGYESWFKKIEELELDIDMVDLKTDGSWMVPEVYLKGALEISNILKEKYGSDSIRIDEINKKYKKLKTSIDSLSVIVSEKKKSIKGLKVICNEHQKDLLLFLGAEVFAVFSPGDDISLKEISEVIKVGREENVQLVVDNLQSGQKVGRTIADELESKYIIFSNFPDERGYKTTLLSNINLLMEILSDKDTKS
ncbi:zinc ABC transporter substrate-binding protein [candidate division WOR-3 bacterium]|nr:zinc ABC transporter substrate-binding protein [candidate division WOR-3 bacterium]